MLDNLVKLSNKYGADENFVLAGGGNTSYKYNGVTYVKASGTSLADIKSEGFVALERDKLEIMRNKIYPAGDAEQEAAVLADLMDARCVGQGVKRPSVETLLHDLFTQAYVLHLHPALVNGVTCGKDGEAVARRLFGNNFVWVPVTKPGYTLSAECKKMMSEYKYKYNKDCAILILQNHGIFWASDDLGELDNMVAETMGKIKAELIRDPDFEEPELDKSQAVSVMPVIRMMYANKIGSETACAKLLCNREISRLVQSWESFAPVAKPFSPDHIVYYKAEPLFVDAVDDKFAEQLDKFITEKGYVPKIIAVRGGGCFALGKTKKECDTAAALFLDAVKIAVYTESFGGELALPTELVNFIISWEVESYREKLALDVSNIKRLDEKICVVTGSAQGFGKGMAELMIKEGACVIIADINYDGAKALAGELNAKIGVNKAFAVHVDLASEQSIKDMVSDIVLEFGGIDIFVNNAGVSFPGSLDEMDLRRFNLITDINYTAYFLCVKYVSKVMKAQHKIAPDIWFDIITISSKSGLAGSNKNSSYAGSKFGGIGLTQSFALELVEYNIKVNAVCPGNFLDGPLWSDPEKGLLVQYLNAGKIPGAKNIDDVRKFYNSKVPMNRGCEVIDVMRAVLYAVEQKYETGQAIPVSGGQIMLN